MQRSCQLKLRMQYQDILQHDLLNDCIRTRPFSQRLNNTSPISARRVFSISPAACAVSKKRVGAVARREVNTYFYVGRKARKNTARSRTSWCRALVRLFSALFGVVQTCAATCRSEDKAYFGLQWGKELSVRPRIMSFVANGHKCRLRRDSC